MDIFDREGLVKNALASELPLWQLEEYLDLNDNMASHLNLATDCGPRLFRDKTARLRHRFSNSLARAVRCCWPAGSARPGAQARQGVRP